MSVRDIFIYRIAGRVSPSWKARLRWAQEEGDAAGKKVVEAVVRQGDTCVDIGANAGPRPGYVNDFLFVPAGSPLPV